MCFFMCMHKPMLPHGDLDHMGEAINLVNKFKVENVIFNCGPYNVLEQELIKVLDKKKIKYYSCIKELNIDNSLRKITQDKTIGLIICKKDNKYIVEYSSDKRILSREYELI